MAVNVGVLEATLGLDSAKFTNGIDQAQGKMQGMGQKMAQTGKMLTMFVSLPLLALGAMAVKTAAQYEQSLTNAVSVTGLTGRAANKAAKEMDKLALAMGRETAFSAQEAATAMYDLASSGWSATQMTKGLRGIMDLAAATQSDLAFTTDLVTSTIAQFGLEAKDSSRVADVFTAAIGSSKANMEKLALSMRYIGPIANSLGWSLESTTATLSKLYDAGFKGEQAGTALRGSISMLLKPSDDAAAAISELSLSVEALNPATHTYDEIIRKLSDNQMDANQAVRIFGQEAAPAVLALANMKKGGKDGAEMIAKLEKELEKAGGRARSVADKQLDTLAGQMKILKGSVETMAIAFGKVLIPALKSLATWLTPIVNSLAEMHPITKKVVFAMMGLAIAVGPVIYLIGKVMLLNTTLTTLAGTSKAAAVGVKILTVSLKALGWITIIVGLMIAAHKAAQWLSTTVGALGDKFKFLAGNIGLLVGPIGLATSLWTTYGNKIKEIIGIKTQQAEKITTIKQQIMKAEKEQADQTKQIEAEVLAVEQATALARYALYAADEAAREELTNRIKFSSKEQIEAFDDAQQKLYEWVGVFEEVPEKLKITGAELTKRLQEQVKRFAEWADNIKNLSGRIPPEMQAELSKMGPLAAGEIEALKNMSDSELAAYVELWKQKHQQAINESVGALSDGKERLRAQTADTLSVFDFSPQASSWGYKTGTSYVDGLTLSLKREAEKKLPGSTGAFAVIDKYMKGQSPPKAGPLKDIDKWGYNVGAAWMKGLTEGVNSGEASIIQRVGQTAKGMVDTFKSNLQSLRGWTDIFSAPRMDEPLTRETLMGNMGAQVDVLKRYQKALKAIAGHVPAAMLQELMAAGPSATPSLEVIAQMVREDKKAGKGETSDLDRYVGMYKQEQGLTKGIAAQQTAVTVKNMTINLPSIKNARQFLTELQAILRQANLRAGI